MVSPSNKKLLLTKEIIVIRMEKLDNEYGITSEYLLYALSHKFVWEHTQNKVFYEPCLPNISNRWKELFIPIFEDKVQSEEIKTIAANIVANQWKSQKDLDRLREFDAFQV